MTRKIVSDTTYHRADNMLLINTEFPLMKMSYTAVYNMTQLEKWFSVDVSEFIRKGGQPLMGYIFKVSTKYPAKFVNQNYVK